MLKLTTQLLFIKVKQAELTMEHNWKFLNKKSSVLSRRKLAITTYCLGLTSFFLIPFFSSSSYAACNNFNPTTGQTTLCDASAPNPTTTNIAAMSGSSNVTINIQQGSQLAIQSSTNPVAVSVQSTSQITNSGSISLAGSNSGSNRGAALLALLNGNTIINASSGVINTTGSFNDGIAANGSNNTLINNGIITTASNNAYGMTAAWGQTNTGEANNSFTNNGSITTHGARARGISVLGQNGLVTNSGSVLTTGLSSNAIYMQGNNDHLINTGSIQAENSDAVFSNTVGSSFTAIIENGVGGQIISQQGSALRTLNGASTIINAGLLQSNGGMSINGGNGNVSLILQTGSTIIGLANGGAGDNSVTLQGTGLITNPFVNFQTLSMQGDDWTWQGSGTFANSYMQTGIFRLQNSLTGNVNISAGASLLAGNNAQPAITPYPGGPTITVTNAGVIDLSNGGDNATDTLTIVGNYVGNSGTLTLQTLLGGDNSPSDKLIISGGSATGLTAINIVPLNNAAALTVANGILVVQALDGATTDNAFAINAPISAGAYEYYLFKGGVTADSSENWYLRNSLLPITPFTPPSASSPAPLLTPDASQILPLPVVVLPGLPAPVVVLPTSPVAASSAPVVVLPTSPVVVSPTPVPLYRVEAPLYSAIRPVVLQTSSLLVGTFHERRGEQSILTPSEPLSATWLRIFGDHSKQQWAGDTLPLFDGSDSGFQTGLDLISTQSVSNHRNNAGLFGGYSNTQGNIRGFAKGQKNYPVGHLKFNGPSLGAYWTHLGPTNWYLDGIIIHSWLNGHATSTRDVSIPISNTNVSTSLEGGYPIPLFTKFIIEPQAQIVWQNMPGDIVEDRYSLVSFIPATKLMGRLGMRLQTNLEAFHGLWQPYLKANVWRHFSRTNTLFLQTDSIATQAKETALQLGGGLVHTFSSYLSAFVVADYTFDVQGEEQRTWAGNAGIRVRLG